MAILKGLFDNDSNKATKKWRSLVDKINALEPKMKDLSDADFLTKTADLKARLKDGASLDDLLPEAYALVRESAIRTRDQRHYDVQLVGAIALHSGNIAEMRT